MKNSKETIEVTCEQLGEVLFVFTLKIFKRSLEEFDTNEMSEKEKSRLGDGLLILDMFAITYACQQKIVNSEMSKHILDSYHERIYVWMRETGGVPEGFEKLLQQHYEKYYNALREDLEARRIGNTPWHMGKVAAEYVFEEPYDPSGITQFFIEFGSAFKTTKELVNQYKICLNNKNRDENRKKSF